VQQNDAEDYAGLAAAAFAVARYSIASTGNGYDLLTDLKDDSPAIRCRRCLRVSHHPRDVEDRYCGYCHAFHESAE
jgi:hypothetical protein